MIKSSEIREKFINFFKKNNHSQIPSASVLPENNSTVLFTTAGVHPLFPYLLWEKHPSWARLVNYQKCVRTGDIDDVWDNSHLTFFEMLWNWSLWDYFKNESIKMSYDFLTKELWIDKNMLAVTVFEWDEDAPRDEESAKIWQEVWISEDRISYLWKDDNWWSAWDTWPCWSDTEIFYWVWESDFPPAWSNVWNDEDNWMEIWNNVFMEFNRWEDWKLSNLQSKNVDTWMWLERITAVLNSEKTVYNTDIFSDIIDVICDTLSLEINNENEKSIRIIADHSRAATFMISDWISPSNVDQWYILRRLIRRAIREGYKLWEKGQFLSPIVEKIINKFEDIYPNIKENKSVILDEINIEEKQFLSTLEKGLKEFDKLIKWFEIAFERTWKKVDTIAWPKAFKLYDTYGFPIEMTKELASERGLLVDEDWFKKAFEEHQEKSRAWASQKFKWGLADDSETTTALHSATHLMLAGLREVLWDHVHQAGSNITPERLRFDFTHPEKVQKDDLEKVEVYVNNAIQSKLKVEIIEMQKNEAKEAWVEGSFWEKYPDIVKVYQMTWENGKVYSKELCWGPHIENSLKMWTFKIKKEEASSRWVRRIKAVLISN